jgi:RES domain-containing protein
MLFYRVYEQLEGRSPLGFGKAAGRWNHSGTPMIYCSSSLALAILELYAIKGSVVSTMNWQVATLEITADIPFIEKLDLPEDWVARPYPKSTLNFGTVWAAQQIGFCVAVPSVRIPLFRFPEEHNLLLNPLYPDFSNHVKVINTQTINFQINRTQ